MGSCHDRGGLGSARAAGRRGSAAAEPPGSELAWKQAAPVCCGLTCMPFGIGLRSPCRGWGLAAHPGDPPRALPRGCSKPQAGRCRSARATAPRKSNAAVARSTPKRVTALWGHHGGLPLSPQVSPEHRCPAQQLGGARLAAPFCARHFPHANGDRKRGWAQRDPFWGPSPELIKAPSPALRCGSLSLFPVSSRGGPRAREPGSLRRAVPGWE